MTSYTAGLIKKYESRGRAEGMTEGLAMGRTEGLTEGMAKLSKLINILMESNRIDDVKKAVSDETYREKLLEEFNLDD